MVRFFHTSDWHLGRLLYGKSLLGEQAHALARLLELIDEKKPQALLISGDIFDRALPPESAVKLFDWFCSEAVLERNLPVFLIPGNHDSAERLGFGSRLLRERGLTIFSRVEDALKPVALKGDASDEILIYGIPFVEPQLIARFLGDDSLKTPDETVRALSRKMIQQHPKGRPSVLLCHAFVIGGQASDSERDLFVGGSAYVNVDAFEGFSYTALGHLHKPQAAGRENVRYSGSLLAYSKSEVSHPKSITEVELQPDGSLTSRELALPASRELIYVEGELQNLLDRARSMSERERDSYVIAGLSDAGPVLDALAKLRAVFPNILHVARTAGYVPASLPSLAKKKERETMSDLDLFAEFFTDTTSETLTSDERTCLVDALSVLQATERERPT